MTLTQKFTYAIIGAFAAVLAYLGGGLLRDLSDDRLFAFVGNVAYAAPNADIGTIDNSTPNIASWGLGALGTDPVYVILYDADSDGTPLYGSDFFTVGSGTLPYLFDGTSPTVDPGTFTGNVEAIFATDPGVVIDCTAPLTRTACEATIDGAYDGAYNIFPTAFTMNAGIPNFANPDDEGDVTRTIHQIVIGSSWAIVLAFGYAGASGWPLKRKRK